MTTNVTRMGALVALALMSPILVAAAPAASLAPVPSPPPAGAPAPPAAPVPLPDATPLIRIAGVSAEVAAADGALADATARRNRVQADFLDAHAALTQAEAVTSTLNVAAADAAARYNASRAELQRVAALTYMQSSSMSGIDVLYASGDPLDASRRLLLLSRADNARKKVAERARADHAAARGFAQQAEAERRRRRARVNEVERGIPPADQAVAGAQAAADRAHGRLNRWLSVAQGADTPILGSPALTAEQLAAWFRATRNRANTTMTIDDLAALFISEAHDEGVRGDIAFAQSILETGSFSYPAGGLVNGTDNNFAGVGACDSCAHGHVYPDARTGVRVQMQYLHVYADRTMTAARFAHPPVDPNMDQNFRKGQAPRWAGLTHTWATADGYADSVMRVYYEILDWVTAHDR
jgi:hypothetical protein